MCSFCNGQELSLFPPFPQERFLLLEYQVQHNHAAGLYSLSFWVVVVVQVNTHT